MPKASIASCRPPDDAQAPSRRARIARARRTGLFALAVVAGVVCYTAVRSLSQVADLLDGLGALSQPGDRAADLAWRTATLPDAARETIAQDDERAEVERPPVIEPQLAQAARLPQPREPALDDAHRPAEPASRPFSSDFAAARARLESLLEADPETLRQVRALLDEPDPNQRARNLELLHETFGLE